MEPQQRRYKRSERRPDIPFNGFQYDYDEKYNDPMPANNSFGIQRSLQSHQARLIACNGDCGSSIAAIINDCVHPQGNGTQRTQVAKSISDALWLHDYPLRKELINLMGKTECYHENDRFQKIYEALKNPSGYISGEGWGLQIIELFEALSTDHMDILNDLANKSCVQPDYSISQEVEQYYERQKDKLWKQVAVQNACIARCAIALNDNYDRNMQSIHKMNQQKKKLMKQLEAFKENQSSIIQETEYESKIEMVKQHPNYLEMQSKNMPLSNQEILAIIIFCEYEIFCREMRESQREEKLNSCQWKKLFHHLCCALYKIYLILHNENEVFYEEYIANGSHGLLFRGIHDVKKAGTTHEIHTVTSFTSDFGVASGFTKNNGLILTIKNAYQAIYDGRLIAASVAWISKFGSESEFILLPATLNNIRFIDNAQLQQDDPYFGFIYNPQRVNIFEARDFTSVDLKPVIWSVSKRRQPPTMWLGDKSPEYIASKKQSATAWIILLGGFLTWQCPICNVKSRLCEYSGNLLDMSVECPSCRSLFLQFGDTNPDEFECYNLACGTIKHKDLEKVVDDGDEWQQCYGMGYRCRKCGKRQRQAQFERYTNEAFMEEQATKYIDAVEKEFKNQINMRKDKDKVKEMILFVMNPDNNKAYIDEILIKFPVIWDWVLQAPGVKEAIDKNRHQIAKVVMKALGLPMCLAPVASGKVKEDINGTIKSVKKEWKRGIKKLRF